jgi:hypothetical protein
VNDVEQLNAYNVPISFLEATYQYAGTRIMLSAYALGVTFSGGIKTLLKQESLLVKN